MINKCGNGFTASGAGVASVAKALVGTMLASDGLTLPAILLIAVVALPACSFSVPMRSCTSAAARVALP
ncbi:hypothetical protein D3C71_2227400 [compost metagenome]